MELLYYLFHKIKHFTKNVKNGLTLNIFIIARIFLNVKKKMEKISKNTILCKFLCFLPLNITECFEKPGLMNKNI